MFLGQNADDDDDNDDDDEDNVSRHHDDFVFKICVFNQVDSKR